MQQRARDNERGDTSEPSLAGGKDDVERTLRALNEELQERELQYRRLVEDSPDSIFVHSEGAIVYANKSAAVMAGAASPDEVLGRSVMAFVHPDSVPTVGGRVKMMLEQGVPAPLMLERFMRLDGSAFYAEAIASPLVFRGKPAIQVIMRDQTERHATEEELQFRSFLLDNVVDGIVVRDAADYCVLYVNEAMCELTARSREEYFSSSDFDWIPGEEREAMRRHVESTLRLGSGSFESFTDSDARGRIPVEIRTSVVTYMGRRALLSMISDISERRAAQETIEHMALHDPLTGLANRALLKDRLELAIARARRKCELLGVIFVDVDHFKTINDTAGHGIGDLVLQSVADRLRQSVRADDTVARLGGDEFMLVLPDIGSEDDGCQLAEKILGCFRKPFTTGSGEVSVTASLGLAVHDGGSMSADDLLRNADLAMYSAKEDGRDAYRLFDPAMNESALERFVLQGDLRRAVERNELSLHYQPIVRLSDGAITGAEALCRWTHPVHGPIGPATFIPLAEESGTICALGTWVLGEACAEAKSWADAGRQDLRVSVNLSPRQMCTGDLVGEVRAVLDATGLDPRMLELELTETVAMRDAPLLIGAFRELRELGVRIAIDDFGTGYSSLDYLKRFPVDALKVDRTFVRDLCEDAGSLAIAHAIVALGSALGLDVIAEGVETEGQRQILVEATCGLAQGFLFSHGVPAEEFRALLESGHVPAPAPADVGS